MGRRDPHLRLELAHGHHLQRSGQRLRPGGQPAQAGVGTPHADQRELRVQGRFQPGQVHIRGCGSSLQPGHGRDRQGLGQPGRHHYSQPRPSQAGGLPGLVHRLIGQGQHVPGPVQQHAAGRVSRSPSRRRCSSGVPTMSSSRLICWLKVGWAMKMFSAARVKLPASASATK